MPRQTIDRSEFASILDIWAEAIESDRREPDKLLCHVASLRRLAADARTEADLSCWPAEDHPLVHAYPHLRGYVEPGEVALCGHVRTEAEGARNGLVGAQPLDACMVCVHLDNAAVGE